jgi:CubicO group peptidase (beta-lactamase class C family)
MHLPTLVIIAMVFSLVGAPGHGGEAEMPPGSRSDLTGAAPLPLTGKRRAAFEAYVADALYRFDVPGAAVAVVENGGVVYLNGFGVKEIGSTRPVTPDTMMVIGSITKPMSTMLAASLVDAGRVTWETRLVDLLSAFAVGDPALTERLTIRDAFCNCSGVPGRNIASSFESGRLIPETVVTALAKVAPTARYGEQFLYNNLLVASGGYALGVANGGGAGDLGLAYDVALHERILGPIGMKHATFDPAAVLAGGDYALPHAVDLSGDLRPIPLLAERGLLPYRPPGALWSNAREMALRADQPGPQRGPRRHPGRLGREPGGNLDAGSVSAQSIRRTAANGGDHDALRARLAEWRVSRPARRQPCRGHRGIHRPNRLPPGGRSGDRDPHERVRARSHPARLRIRRVSVQLPSAMARPRARYDACDVGPPAAVSAPGIAGG